MVKQDRRVTLSVHAKDYKAFCKMEDIEMFSKGKRLNHAAYFHVLVERARRQME